MAQCKVCGKKGILLKLNADGVCQSCEINYLKNMLLPEQQEISILNAEISRLSEIKQEIQLEIDKKSGDLNEVRSQIDRLQHVIEHKNTEIVHLDESISMQEVGLYEPHYDFCHAEEYKKELDRIRNLQKDAIRNREAVTGETTWTVNGSLAQGKKVVSDMQKLLLRAFNSECDDIIEHVKYNNFDSALKRMIYAANTIGKLGVVMQISITNDYFSLKEQELRLALEYRIKKQQEKEEEKELRAQLREEAKLQKEIEQERKKAEKEKSHYLNALHKIQQQIDVSNGVDISDLEEKKKEIESQLEDVEKAIQNIDYREANKRAGYVYVISNIGSFGENVYKIGMTRRLDPMERVSELSDASVPFNFDIHAMIFSDDAPALETALHHAFEDKKVNMVNQRREFFRVTLDEIKEVVRQNYDKTAEFYDVPDAEQYRISETMRKNSVSSDI